MHSQDKYIKDILTSHDTISVPDFQRPISWGSSEIEKLQQDLESVILNQTGEHFIGTMVVERPQNSQAPHQMKIWDGQQRIFSFMAMVCAARDILMSDPNNIPNLSEGTFIQSNYVLRGTPHSSPPQLLTLGRLDNSTFERFVIVETRNPNKLTVQYWDSLNPTQQQAWSKNVIEIYESMYNWLVDIGNKHATPSASSGLTIAKFVSDVVNRSKLILAITHDASDAFVTFETLNDRGLGLSASDLLKNYLIANIPSQSKNQFIQEWDDMVRLMDVESVTTYIRHFYMSRFGSVTKNTLYHKITGLCNSSPPRISATDLARDITNSSAAYIQFLSEYQNWSDSTLERSIEHLRGFDTTQWLPILLAAHDAGYSEQDLGTLAYAIEVLFVRTHIIAGKSYAGLVSFFSEKAQTLWGVKNSAPNVMNATLDTVIAEIKSRIISDAEFVTTLENLPELQQKTAKYLLECLERHYQRVNATGTAPHIQVLDIEHIYPRTDGPGWPNQGSSGYVDPSDRERLGNLALLHFTKNRSAKNASFSTKVQTYNPQTCNLHFTRGLASLPNWDLQSIIDRQKDLAQYSLQVWPLPP